MQLGCNTVIFGKFPLEVALQSIAWSGFRNAHLAALPGMAEHVSPQSDGGEVAALLKKYGLGVSGIEVTYDMSQPETAERMHGILQLAHDLECGVIAIPSRGTTGDEESYLRFIEGVRPYTARAKALGIRLALKGHVGQAVYNTDTMLRAISDVGLQGFGVNADPSHLYRANENPHESVQRLSGAIAMVHIRDCPHRNQPPGSPEQQVPGQGEMNLPAMIAALHEVGYNGALDLEIIGAHQYTDLSRCTALAAQSCGYLRRCLKEAGILQ